MIASAVCALSLVASAAHAQDFPLTSPNHEIPALVVGGGGGPASSANFDAFVVIGQPIVGITTATNELCAGFLCGGNSAPTAQDAIVNAVEDTDLGITLEASDPEGASLTWLLEQGPQNGALLGSLPNLTYRPDANFNGADSFSFKVNDGELDSNIATVTINVAAVNDAPVAADDTGSTNEDTPLAIPVANLLANDADIDGDGLSVSNVHSASNGTVQLAGGVVTFTPSGNFNGAASFSYDVSDGNGGSDTAQVSVTVLPVNDAPVAVADSASTPEDTALQLSAATLLGNDGDVENDPLQLTQVSSATNGVATLTGGGVQFVPTANFAGQASFVYTVTDGSASDTATVTITVTPVNDPPVAGDDVAATDEDTLGIIPMPNLLANDSDIDGGALAIGSVQNAVNGSVQIGNLVVEFTPAANFNGVASFEYTVVDGHGGSDTATVTVTVNPVNDAPEAGDDSAATDEDTPLLITTAELLANDDDAEGTALQITGVSGAENGTATLVAGGVQFDPAADFNGQARFDYTVTDGDATDTARVTIAVTPINDDPRAGDDTATTDEDTQLDIPMGDLLANDSDIDSGALLIDTVQNAANGTVQIGNLVVEFTPAANFNGVGSFDYTVIDGDGGSDTATVTVTVRSVNDAPVAGDDNGATDEDTLVLLTTAELLANDSDVENSPLQITGVSAASNGTANLVAGGVEFTPAADYHGPASFEYTVSDGEDTDTATVNIVVSQVNDLPVANDDTQSTDEDVAFNFDPRGNDSDVDGDSLTITATSAAANGVVTIEGAGLTYKPNANFNGADLFTYTISDGNGAVATAKVNVTVVPVNDAPAANDDSVTTPEDASLNFDARVNDLDIDGDALTADYSGSTPSNGSVVAELDGTVTYTPNANFNGQDSFSYSLSDGNGGVDTATVTVTVTAVNDVPVANDDTATVDEDDTVFIDALGNDSDIDGDSLEVTGTSTPANGSVLVGQSGTLRYTPNANFNGNDSFTYDISDGSGGSATATVSVTVNPVNDAPVAQDDSSSVDEDGSVLVSVLANDSDLDLDSLSILGFSQGSNGAVDLENATTLRYTPGANFNGNDSFTYTADDGNGGTDTATVSVTVNPVNDAPVAVQDSLNTPEDTPVVADLAANDTDIENDTLSVIAVSAANDGSTELLPNGSVRYTPDPDFNGADGFTYTLSDGNGGVVSGNVKVVVDPRNDGPVANDDVDSTLEDAEVVLNVLSNDSDADGDALRISGVSVATHGAVEIVDAVAGTVRYTPEDDFNGFDSFQYTADDANGGEATATVTIEVLAVDDLPEPADDVAGTVEDTAVTIAVLANDVNVDGDALVVTLPGSPGNGSAEVTVDNTVLYTPDANFNGVDSFTYVVTDTQGNNVSAEVTVTVSAEDDAPVVALGPDREVDEGSALSFTATFTDADSGDTHTATFNWNDGNSDSPAVDQAADTATASHTWEDNRPGEAPYQVQVEIQDSTGLVGTDMVLVTVRNVAPVVDAGPPIVNTAAGAPLDFSGSFTDAGAGDSHTVQWDFEGDGSATANTLDAQHSYVASGTFTATLTVTDDDGGVGSDSVQVNVISSEDGINSNCVEIAGAGELYEYDANSVVEGTPDVSYSLVSGPPGMNVDADSGLVSWTPDDADLGQTVSFRLRLTISDVQLDQICNVDVIDDVIIANPGRGDCPNPALASLPTGGDEQAVVLGCGEYSSQRCGATPLSVWLPGRTLGSSLRIIGQPCPDGSLPRISGRVEVREDNVSIENVEFFSSPWGFEAVSVKGLSVTNSVFHGCRSGWQPALNLHDVDGAFFANNRIGGCYSGVQISNRTRNAQFINNSVYGVTYAVFLDAFARTGSPGLVFENNILQARTAAFYNPWGMPADLQSDHNLYVLRSRGLISFSPRASDLTTWNTKSGLDAASALSHDLSEVYASVDANDTAEYLRLVDDASNPALDLGTPHLSVGTDFEGQARDLPPDAGADEL